jgi:hypothetical protein
MILSATPEANTDSVLLTTANNIPVNAPAVIASPAILTGLGAKKSFTLPTV